MINRCLLRSVSDSLTTIIIPSYWLPLMCLSLCCMFYWSHLNVTALWSSCCHLCFKMRKVVGSLEKLSNLPEVTGLVLVPRFKSSCVCVCMCVCMRVCVRVYLQGLCPSLHTRCPACPPMCGLEHPTSHWYHQKKKKFWVLRQDHFSEKLCVCVYVCMHIYFLS